MKVSAKSVVPRVCRWAAAVGICLPTSAFAYQGDQGSWFAQRGEELLELQLALTIAGILVPALVGGGILWKLFEMGRKFGQFQEQFEALKNGHETLRAGVDQIRTNDLHHLQRSVEDVKLDVRAIRETHLEGINRRLDGLDAHVRQIYEILVQKA